MVNKPLIRPCFLGGVALGGVARIPMISSGSCLNTGKPVKNEGEKGSVHINE